MKFPLISFAIALTIWIFFIGIFAYFSFQKSAIEPATLEVDASIIDEVSRQVEHDKNPRKDSVKNDSQKIEKILQEKILEQRKVLETAQEKLKEKLQEEAQEKSQEKSLTNPNDLKPEKIATITARPLPEIPEELRQEAFNNYAIARFHIAADGSATVELIKPCNNPRLNQLLLQSLRKWKFSPAHTAGIAVSSTQDVKVNFKVE